MFNEQCNGDYKTDYASPLRELSLENSSSNMPLLQINSVTNEWEVSYDNGATWTSLNVKATGDKGDRGDTGASGMDGANGADGKDGITPMLKVGDDNMWHVSYDNGNVWTSLGVKATGAKGDKGDTGASGKDGSNGVDGENGVGISSANINEEGELILIYTNGASINLGRIVGKDGLTPYIGDNGNWWLGEKDTGVSAIAVLESDLLSSPVIITIGTIAGLAFISNVGLILYIVFKKK